MPEACPSNRTQRRYAKSYTRQGTRSESPSLLSIRSLRVTISPSAATKRGGETAIRKGGFMDHAVRYGLSSFDRKTTYALGRGLLLNAAGREPIHAGGSSGKEGAGEQLGTVELNLGGAAPGPCAGWQAHRAQNPTADFLRSARSSIETKPKERECEAFKLFKQVCRSCKSQNQHKIEFVHSTPVWSHLC